MTMAPSVSYSITARLEVASHGRAVSEITRAVEQSGPLRLGDLAAAEGIAPSTLTRMVAVLEDLGYVRRDADPRDARASTLAITAKGHETLERLRAEGTALLTQWLATLSLDQRAALATALPALEALAEPDTPVQRSR